MDLSGDIWDLNDTIEKFNNELESWDLQREIGKDVNEAYTENLVRAVQHIEKAVGFLEEADRVQPLSKAVK